MSRVCEQYSILINSHSPSDATPRKEPRQERSRRTVAAILEAAAQLFAAQGYTATTTNHVAAEAGVSIGSLYQYFPNKDALVGALVLRHLDETARELAGANRRLRSLAPAPGAWAEAFVTALVRANDSELDLVLYGIMPSLPAIRTQLDGLIDRLVTQVAHHLRRFGHGRAARSRARVIVVTAIALVHEVVITVPEGRGRQRAAREVIDLIARYARPRTDGT